MHKAKSWNRQDSSDVLHRMWEANENCIELQYITSVQFTSQTLKKERLIFSFSFILFALYPSLIIFVFQMHCRFFQKYWINYCKCYLWLNPLFEINRSSQWHLAVSRNRFKKSNTCNSSCQNVNKIANTGCNVTNQHSLSLSGTTVFHGQFFPQIPCLTAANFSNSTTSHLISKLHTFFCII